MLKITALTLAIAVLALLAFTATRPENFRVERQTTIRATPERISAFITDFHKWSEWSPWEKIDLTMKRSFSGATSGKGAVYAWEGSGKAGAGRMEILDAPPFTMVQIKLDFIKPFEGHNTTEFTFKPLGADTQVTWVMYGPAPFISKLMGFFFNMDTMIGTDFEAGLRNLKAAAEK